VLVPFSVVRQQLGGNAVIISPDVSQYLGDNTLGDTTQAMLDLLPADTSPAQVLDVILGKLCEHLEAGVLSSISRGSTTADVALAAAGLIPWVELSVILNRTLILNPYREVVRPHTFFLIFSHVIKVVSDSPVMSNTKS
jgi:hypothetical protein